ncbi:hypothetical protein [Frondihabitans cladoniiphilus]|uniref:Uncharacterized protein n=1 Tax=Frondihabitans cladoniiphilus TaxID=715785 RepID=A0ABP8VML7_9MICO
MSSSPTSPFTMLGAADAAACEGDSCLLPGAAAASEAPGAAAALADAATDQDPESPNIEPGPDEAAAASSRAVIAALDEGASL